MGKLFVVATPIGNLKDITLRALEVLKEVEVIACEDTRTTRKLLNHYGITGKKLVPYHDHNEEEASERLLKLLKECKDVALVSDAGTPCISDPGYRLVRKAWENGIQVVPIPGAFAGVVALSSSGLPPDRFLFVGFLPNKDKQRREEIQFYNGLGITYILYESPKRVLKTLKVLEETAPNSQVVVAKELTKLHEKFFRGKPAQVRKMLEEDSSQLKGEFVILVYPVVEKEVSQEEIEKTVKKLSEEGLKTSQIAKAVSKQFNIPKSQAYKTVLELLKE
ncbi:MAG: 16S rRNA (cytidine(1402)-2'-O)-methyltransferase [Aquificae bacterium]|nr:16S rRNA (cytidine(1402)-2'-O)-methyltransferase [Aquificota bacterium]